MMGKDLSLEPDNPSPDLGGSVGVGVIVGEGDDGRGLRDGTAELAEFKDDGSVRFIPIKSRGAGGLEVKNLGTSGLTQPISSRPRTVATLAALRAPCNLSPLAAPAIQGAPQRWQSSIP